VTSVTDLLEQLKGMSWLQFLVAIIFVALCDWRIRHQLNKAVQQGVSGAIEPWTSAISKNSDEIADLKARMVDTHREMVEIDLKAVAANRRLDTLGVPRVVAP
jgi:hypothetical protein